MNNLDITRTFLARNNDEVAAQKLATLFDAIDEFIEEGRKVLGLQVETLPLILKLSMISGLIADIQDDEKQEAEDISKLHDLIQQHPTEAKYYLDNMEVDS